ncbi:MAG: hypothetical protein KF834_01415 [Burkholderiales bacterium]|nr:hypothetical protein [Burkholderiales bacterium]
MNTGSEPRFLQSRWIRVGVAGLVLGTGPLLLAVAISYLMGDRNPNPVGPGILAFLTFWPSILLVLIGVVVTIFRKIRFARSND